MLHLPLRTVQYIMSEFEEKFDKYSVETFVIDEFQKCVVLEDSLVLYIGILESKFPLCTNIEQIYGWTKNNNYMDYPSLESVYYELYIEELTFNTLGFKYNHSKFIRDITKETQINYLGLDIEYKKFKGYTRLYWAPEVETLTEKIDKLIPNLRLRERYETWEGVEYNFVVMKIKTNDMSNNFEYAVAYTTLKPHSYILSKGNEWIKGGIRGGDFRQRGQEFYKAFDSWKGLRRQLRLENHFEYCSVQKYLREKDDAWRYADNILELSYQGKFENVDFINYNKPENKWKSEELVFNIVKKCFKEHIVLYQHRPFFLKSDIGGQMSYDVFISGLNIAIEYQGKQHFEPVEFFGGLEAFNRTIVRDAIKSELSKQNNVKLIYINYWENISPDLILDKINEVLM